MNIIHIDSLDIPDLKDYTSLTDVNLRRLLEPEGGLYLAESPKVIERSLAAGHRPRSVLLLEEWLPKIAPLLASFPKVPIYVGTSEQLEQLTGFHMHRGAIAAMHRPDPVDPREILKTAKRVVVLEDIMDHTNVGAIFRSVAALGADAVLVSPRCADPLYRRSVRVSMGSVLMVPWARIPDWKDAAPMFAEAGFRLAALALAPDAVDLAEFVANPPEKVALMLGAEGDGLSRKALHAADTVVTIPMELNVDSLNVATAAAVALWGLRAFEK